MTPPLKSGLFWYRATIIGLLHAARALDQAKGAVGNAEQAYSEAFDAKQAAKDAYFAALRCR